MVKQLLSDAKLAEDGVEQIFRCSFADELAPILGLNGLGFLVAKNGTAG